MVHCTSVLRSPCVFLFQQTSPVTLLLKLLLSCKTLSVNADSSYGSINFKHAHHPCPCAFVGHFSYFLHNIVRIALWNKNRVQNYAPPMRQTNDEVLLREAASHISVCHTRDLKWGPLKVYSYSFFKMQLL